MGKLQAKEALGASSFKTVVMFSGQGSQKPGMGQSLFGRAKTDEIMTCASDIFGLDVAKMMTQSDAETLNDTRFAQAALLTLSLALYCEIEEQGFSPDALLGFSLGQVSAAYASGMLSLEETFRFGKIRSELMADAAKTTPGKMCALLGAEEEEVQHLCKAQAQGEILGIANYNCPGQIVISGNEKAIERAYNTWTAQKKRASILATSGAFHSPLMSEAAKGLELYLSGISFQQPNTPLISNLDAKALDAGSAKRHYVEHLTHPVLFQQSIENLRESGAALFVELGYGGVLSALVKRIDRNSQRRLIESADTLEAFIAENEERDAHEQPA